MTRRLSSPVEHAPIALLGDAQRLAQDPLRSLAGQRGGEHDVGPGQVRRLAPQALQPLVGGVLVLLDRVPLVEHEDDALVRLEHVADDVRVLRRVALGRIGHDDRHVGRVDRLHAAQHAVALDPPLDAPRGGECRPCRPGPAAGRRARSPCRSGRAWCRACRDTIMRSEPRTRFTKVDLPVFGRPTIATRGAPSSVSASSAISSSVEVSGP